MDDPGKYTRLSTLYGNALTHQDPHKDHNNIPSVTLETGGSEVIKMEDGQPDYGNNIKVSTADGHFLLFAQGPSTQGITAATRKGNVLALNDKDQNITIQTTSGHRILMDDANKTLVVTSKDTHRIEVNDGKSFIEVADSSGQHRFKIDIANKQLTIATDTGSIDILAPQGTVRIDAKAVAVKAQTGVNVECDNLTTKAQTSASLEAQQVKTKASSIEENASGDITMAAANISSKASMNNKTEGSFVNSEANGVNTIKGMLVKIN
jgi:hypothetical protein